MPGRGERRGDVIGKILLGHIEHLAAHRRAGFAAGIEMTTHVEIARLLVMPGSDAVEILRLRGADRIEILDAGMTGAGQQLMHAIDNLHAFIDFIVEWLGVGRGRGPANPLAMSDRDRDATCHMSLLTVGRPPPNSACPAMTINAIRTKPPTIYLIAPTNGAIGGAWPASQSRNRLST